MEAHESTKVFVYDTALRDGSQAENISFSVLDKVRIALRLDEFGIDYIEGGWPGSNPKDCAFFEEIRKQNLRHAKISAFGSTCRPNTEPGEDHNLKLLLGVETPVVTIFGKSWLLHVEEALRILPDENLRMIRESVRFLHAAGREVLYDAEHFFDGFKDEPDYALKTLEAAIEGGADCLVLCDTNGGTLPDEINEIVADVLDQFDVSLGIHCHDDGGVGVANSLAAVRAGAVHVQGTINGYGERCGNANLCSIIPNLMLKMGMEVIPAERLSGLRDLSLFVDEQANQRPNTRAPYVGESAFAHKGGIHVSAVQRLPETYEHIAPELVGNGRRVLVSELSGRSNILVKAEERGIKLPKDSPQLPLIVEKLKRLESEGYEFEAAEGSFELLLKKELKNHRPFFELDGFRVIVEKRGGDDGRVLSEATIRLRVGDETEYTAAEAGGPVEALDIAMRKALLRFYPSVQEVRLCDYKVRIIDTIAATAAKTRVLIESSDGTDVWGTVGVSENIIEASWQALVDSVEFKLLKDEEESVHRT